MADLGFLPGVTRILAATPAGGQRMMFSATLDNGVDKLVKRFLHNPVTHSIDEAHSPVPEMTHHVFHVTGVQAKKELVHHLASGTGRRILFMRTKHQARKLAKQLTESGVPSVDLHGNLSQPARDRNLAAFSTGRGAGAGGHRHRRARCARRRGRTRRARGPADGTQGLSAPVRPDRTGGQLGRRGHRGAARAAQRHPGTDAQGRDQCPPAGGRRALSAGDGTGRRGRPVQGSRSRESPGSERRANQKTGGSASPSTRGGKPVAPDALNIATTQAVGAASQAEPEADLANIGCSARAAQTMSSAVRNASVSWWTEKTGSPAARRSNMTARAVLVSPRHDQEARAGTAAGDGHDALRAGVAAGNGGITAVVQGVEIGDTLQGRPVDADVDDLAQWPFQRLDQLGKFLCDRRPCTATSRRQARRPVRTPT